MTKTIVMWDWDGTIVDSRGSITQSLNDLAAHYKQEPVTLAEVANVMSFHKGAFWIRRFAERMDEAFDYFVARLNIHSKTIVVAPGIVPCLDYLKSVNISQIVASNCPEPLLKQECATVQLTDYFERLCGTSLTDNIKKPSPDFISKLNGIDFDRCIMIGDGTSDMLFAHNIGALGIYVQATPFRDLNMPHDIYCPDTETLLQTLHQICEDK